MGDTRIFVVIKATTRKKQGRGYSKKVWTIEGMLNEEVTIVDINRLLEAERAIKALTDIHFQVDLEEREVNGEAE